MHPSLTKIYNMGGKSLKTVNDHKNVVDLYFEKMKKRGAYSSEAKKGTLHDEVADKTGYSTSSVRQIISAHFRKDRLKSEHKQN